MEKAWYILNYHDISWEESLFARGIGGTVPPDIFREQLEKLSQEFKLVSVQQGYDLYQKNQIDKPLVSFWFDDGLTGVRKYAYPLLEEYEVKAAMSVNSRFTLKKEFFWRFKLSLLSQLDGMRFLRSRLKKYGYKRGMSVKAFVLDNFSEDIINIIDEVYSEYTNESFRKDSYRLFDAIDGIRELADNGWLIANHSASHYPIAEETYIHKFKEQFEECEKDITQHLNIETQFWTIPFDRCDKRSEKLMETFNKVDNKNRSLVLVGGYANKSYGKHKKVVYRIVPRRRNGDELVRFLKGVDVG